MTFGPTALSQVYGIPLVAAAAIITAYFVGSISGTFSGGFGAQKTTNHVGLLVVCVLSAAGAMGLIATGMLPVSLLWLPAGAFGFALGFANPSRDIIVRGIAPPHARGKVYGLVYGGMDAGAALAPLPLGWLLDHGYPSALFAVAAIAVLAVLPSVLMLRERTMRAAPA